MPLRSLCLFALLAALGAADHVWIEGEAPSTTPVLRGDGAPADHGFAREGWGDRAVMSGGEVLHVRLDPQQVAAFVGDDYIFGYDLTLPGTGPRELWARIGYEWARSELEWRIDGGGWTAVTSNAPTINVQPIQTWNELGWIRLATVDLAAGDHRLEVRFPKRQHGEPEQLQTERVLAMIDCFCLAAAGFTPHGRFQPGADHRGEREHQAAAHRFSLETAAGEDGRAWTSLDGWWEYAAFEETSFPIDEATRLQPVEALPADENLRWFAYHAPGDRDAQLPAEAMAHRYLLRCRVDVPPEASGRGCFLDVQRSNLIISVFVNGAFAGWTDTFHAAWQLDLSPHLRPGETNDLVLAVKDAYYSLNPSGDDSATGLGNRRYWNLPRDFLHSNQGTASHHDLPVAADLRNGILEPASLVLCGRAYAADVFAQPSVSAQRLDLTVELFNPATEAVPAELRTHVEPWAGGAVECRFEPQAVDLAPGAVTALELSQAWAEPRLWWPDDPHLYAAVTQLVIDGEVVDTKRTRFGFREWDWTSDHLFRLNGVKWQLWADTNDMPSPQQQIELMRESGANQLRYWRNGGWGDLTRREALSLFDETGIIVRSSGTFDGQLANYGGGLREQVDGQTVAKQRLWDAWRKQMTAWVREERNHPSIYIWSVENEIAYINVQNLGQWQECEPELRKGVEHVMALDPTRPGMVDGGNALRDESLPVNGAHYTEFMNVDFRDFPDAAYTREHFYDPERPQRGAWRMVPDRPIMKGEVYFAEGYSTERFATIGGERCFIGIGETMAARGLWARMLSEGYRWSEIASWHFWLGNAERQYWTVWQPVVVLCRQWDSSWGSGQTISRELRTFNGTRHADPITMGWELELAGQRVAGGEQILAIPPGEAESVHVTFTLPAVEVRSEGRLVLTASRQGKALWRDEKPISVLAPASLPKPGLEAEALAVIDPQGTVTRFLQAAGIGFTAVAIDATVPAAAEVIVIGADAIALDRSTDSRWLAAAAAGKKVLVLDQAHPLAYGAIPADLDPTGHVGRFAFAEDLSHPILRGLQQSDFFTWSDDHVVYRGSYQKGSRGGRSLVQCDNGLGETALFESQVNDGLLLLCQLAVGSKLEHSAVAQQLLRNMLNYAADYRPVRKQSFARLDAASPAARLLGQLGLEHELVAEPLDALRAGQVAIVDATPANLAALAAAKDRVDSFTRSGGWLMLWGLTPEGLADFNTLVDAQHAMRAFDRERVLLSVPTDPLASGLTLRDVVMDTGKNMYPWMALKEPDREAWGHLVDHLDIAPFCTFPTPTSLGKPSDTDPGVDHWPRNMVNGFTSDDNWSFTYTIIMDQGHSRRFTLELPKEEELVALKIRPSKIYHPITKMRIYFDDDPDPIEAVIPVREQPLTEEIPIEGRKASRITLEVAEWAERGDRNIVVIDNLWLQVKRSDDYLRRVSSLLNIGGLMAYRQGDGGILLNQLQLLPQELNPDNAEKKATIVKTLLANLGAVFQGAQTTVQHRVFAYHPLRIPDGAFTAYAHRRGEPGWFAGGGDLEALPVGERRFAGASMFLSDFSTSPVPSLFMLRGDGSSTQEAQAEIAVERRADSLFLLHTFHPGHQLQHWQRQVAEARDQGREAPTAPSVLHYRVRYADGSEHLAEVVYGQQIGAWNDPGPQALPGAALAWSGQSGGGTASVWLMRWDNPHPERVITSVTAEAVADGGLGAAVILAVTAGDALDTSGLPQGDGF